MLDLVDRDALVDLTRRLVAVDTQNPPGNEAAVIGVCRDALAPFDAEFEEVVAAPGRTSLIARLGAGRDGDRPTLIVNGHLDVVPVEAGAWSRDPFGGDVEDGRLYGRGAADMKGGIAAAVEGLHLLQRAGREPAWDIVFHLVADEERGGGLGTAVLSERGLIEGDACIVPEPTGLGVCVAERGIFVARVTTVGTPAHGSEPRKGVSAIETAAKVVLALHAADFGGPDHELLGRPTCNVGQIAGGTGHNTVAERCEVVIDRRLLPGVTAAEVEAEIRARIEAIGDPELHYELVPDVYGEASELDAAHPFVAHVQDCLAAVRGQTSPVIGMRFTTDARFVRNQGGIPAVVCGPGEVAQAHVHDEWVAVDRLAEAAAVYAELYARPG